MYIVVTCGDCGKSMLFLLEQSGSETACSGCGKSILISPPLAEEVVEADPIIEISSPSVDEILDAEPVIEPIDEPVPSISPFDFEKATADVPDEVADSTDRKPARFGPPPPIDSERWEIALLGLKTARLGSQIALGLLIALFGIALVGRFSLLAWIVVPYLLRPIEIALAFVYPIGRVLCTYTPGETRSKWAIRLSALFAVLASGTYLAWLLRTLIKSVGAAADWQVSPRSSSDPFDQVRLWVVALLLLSEFWFIVYMGRLGRYLRNRGIGGSRLFLFGCIVVSLCFWILIVMFPVAQFNDASVWYLLGLPVIAGIVAVAIQLRTMQDVAIKTIQRAADLLRPKAPPGLKTSP